MPLKWDNYVEKLSDLLHIEELQMEVDIRRYDLEGTTMKKDGGFLRLKVSHFHDTGCLWSISQPLHTNDVTFAQNT